MAKHCRASRTAFGLNSDLSTVDSSPEMMVSVQLGSWEKMAEREFAAVFREDQGRPRNTASTTDTHSLCE